MLSNIFPIMDAQALSRWKRRSDDFRSVPASALEDYEINGWELLRENKRTVRLRRPNPANVLLEDRVWYLLYKMGFDYISEDGGAFLYRNSKESMVPECQIDVLSIDNEVALVIECTTADKPKKNSSVDEIINKHVTNKHKIAQSIHSQYKLNYNGAIVFIIWTHDVIIGRNTKQKAIDNNIILLNKHDLLYYEQLVSHLGPAAKYQFFADMMPHKNIHGLKISMPALETKMGGYTCYVFSISPSYLLKISYVSHRAKGKPTDVDTYQRMIKKSRLNKIKKYIDEGGIFPTNIVLGLDTSRKSARFDLGPQQMRSSTVRFGTLHLSSAYKSAWIIDGQHRLYAYSGHEKADSACLQVIAFDGLPASDQAQLFIDINNEQKSVKRNLLHELYAELNWNADDEEKRIRAIISKAIQIINESEESQLYNRILLADKKRTDVKCITLESIFKELSKPYMYIVKSHTEYGALWAGENELTRDRTIKVVNAWFDFIVNEIKDWWDKGSGDGGGIAMNDGVTICLGVLRDVFQQLHDRKINLVRLTDIEIIDNIRKYGISLGKYYASFNEEQRLDFRNSIRGVQGQTLGRLQCEQALRKEHAEFNPTGLEEFIKQQEERTNEKAYGLIREIEKIIAETVISSLQMEYKERQDEEMWWYEGIPGKIRVKAVQRMEEDKGKREKQNYMDLIDYREVIIKNWTLFKNIFSYDNKGNKENKTKWIAKINECRKIMAHSSSSQNITIAQVRMLEEYLAWIKRQIYE